MFFASLQLKVSNMSEEPAIYDSIVKEYSNAKTNPYKSYIEEPTFWRCLGTFQENLFLILLVEVAIIQGKFSFYTIENYSKST